MNTFRLVYSAYLAAACSALFTVTPAHATVVLDTFGPANTANGSFHQLGRFSSPDGSFLAAAGVAFSLSETSTITEILTSISGFGAFTLGVSVGPALPVANLDSFSLLPPLLNSTVLSNPTGSSAATGLNWTLPAGAYWLVAEPVNEGDGIWRGGQQSSSSKWAFASLNCGGTAEPECWNPQDNFDAPAARIIATPIPEPSSWALMLGGLALCGAAARLRRG